MKSFGKWQPIAAALVLAVAVAAPAVAQDKTEAMNKEGITYMSGGIGLEEREAFKAEAKDYNLLVSNANKGGHLTADVAIVVKSLKGKELLTVEDAGPLFYAKLPAGSYIIEAMSGEQHAKRRITVAGHKQAKLYFIWGNGALCNGAIAEAPKVVAETPKTGTKKAVRSVKKHKAKKESRKTAPAVKKGEPKTEQEKAVPEVKKEEPKDKKDQVKPEEKKVQEPARETPKDEKAKTDAKEGRPEVKKEEPKDKKEQAKPEEKKAKEPVKEVPKETAPEVKKEEPNSKKNWAKPEDKKEEEKETPAQDEPKKL
jgi:hypothetical protein